MTDMTEQDWIELGKRAVACKGWRWMPGMRYSTDSWRAEGFERVPERMDAVAHADWMAPGRVPDLTDPATIGCLYVLVGELYGISDITVRTIYENGEIDRWAWNSEQVMKLRGDWNSVLGVGSTYAHGGVAALEGAPC